MAFPLPRLEYRSDHVLGFHCIENNRIVLHWHKRMDEWHEGRWVDFSITTPTPSIERGCCV